MPAYQIIKTDHSINPPTAKTIAFYPQGSYEADRVARKLNRPWRRPAWVSYSVYYFDRVPCCIHCGKHGCVLIARGHYSYCLDCLPPAYAPEFDYWLALARQNTARGVHGTFHPSGGKSATPDELYEVDKQCGAMYALLARQLPTFPFDTAEEEEEVKQAAIARFGFKADDPVGLQAFFEGYLEELQAGTPPARKGTINDFQVL
jgi:hypothetical protein